VDEATRQDVTQRLEELAASARMLADRAREALEAMHDGDPRGAYAAIHRAHGLDAELAAARESFQAAGVYPRL
jgi:hypothetical protein